MCGHFKIILFYLLEKKKGGGGNSKLELFDLFLKFSSSWTSFVFFFTGCVFQHRARFSSLKTGQVGTVDLGFCHLKMDNDTR